MQQYLGYFRQGASDLEGGYRRAHAYFYVVWLREAFREAVVVSILILPKYFPYLPALKLVLLQTFCFDSFVWTTVKEIVLVFVLLGAFWLRCPKGFYSSLDIFVFKQD